MAAMDEKATYQRTEFQTKASESVAPSESAQSTGGDGSGSPTDNQAKIKITPGQLLAFAVFSIIIFIGVYLSNGSKPLVFEDGSDAVLRNTVNWIYHNENAAVLRLPIVEADFGLVSEDIPNEQQTFEEDIPEQKREAQRQAQFEAQNIAPEPSGGFAGNRNQQDFLQDQFTSTARALLVAAGLPVPQGRLTERQGYLISNDGVILAVSFTRAEKIFDDSVDGFSLVQQKDRIVIQKDRPQEQPQLQQKNGTGLLLKDFEQSIPEFYQKSPSLLTYLLLLVWGGVGVWLFVIRPRVDIHINLLNMTEFFASDKPIENEVDDVLGFNALAKSISKFLRHSHTSPPLTLGISGPWGKGKSSLMRLVQSDLNKVGARSAWINAWHHQNEEQFLYGVMAILKDSVLPDLLSFDGLNFRFRLIFLRLARMSMTSRMFIATLFLGSVVGLLIVLVNGMELGIKQAIDELTMFGKEAFVAISVVVTPVLTMWGLSREKLSGYLKQGQGRFLKLGSVTGSLDSNAGIRHKFALEFADICQALGESRLTIFIDDLDRCSEKRIMEVLEVVNFLVSSGQCYVVLGMAEEPVKRAICNHYEDQFHDYEFANSAEKFHSLRSMADDYLEKIINISVPVPTAEPLASKKLVSEKKPFEEKIKLSIYLAPVAIVLVLFLSSLQAIDFYYFENQPFFGLFADEGKALDVQGQVGVNTSPAEPVSLSGGERLFTTNLENQTRNLWILIASAVFVLSFALYYFVRMQQKREKLVVEDTENFKLALEDALGILAEFKPKPRNIKRYVNRTRFFNLRSEGIESINENLLTKIGILYEFIGSDLVDSKDIKVSIEDKFKTNYAALNKPTKETLDRYLEDLDLTGNNAEAIKWFIFLIGGITVR